MAGNWCRQFSFYKSRHVIILIPKKGISSCFYWSFIATLLRVHCYLNIRLRRHTHGNCLRLKWYHPGMYCMSSLRGSHYDSFTSQAQQKAFYAGFLSIFNVNVNWMNTQWKRSHNVCLKNKIFVIGYIYNLKVINHCIFRNLKAVLYGKEHQMHFCNIPVFMRREEKIRKKKCLNDQKRRFSEYSVVNHLN